MNNAAIIKIINSDNSYITYVKTEYCEFMTTNANKTLKFKSIVKKSKVINLTFFTIITFSMIIFLLNQFYRNIVFIRLRN